MKKMIALSLLFGIVAGLAGCRAPGGVDYLVVDLSGGASAARYPVRYLDAPPRQGWTLEDKTSRMVLRRIPAGEFLMGAPADELGRTDREIQHPVRLTRDFYIGVFEVTQKQWERVMGDWPSYFGNPAFRDARPVEQVSYNAIRGADAGSGWPATADVDADSFLGRLRARTGLSFDLPTEAQWEYAGRAGTIRALNSDKDLTGRKTCPNLAGLGRYYFNAPGGFSEDPAGGLETGTAEVGSYPPNAFGLYDFHGNAWEWCLDWFGAFQKSAEDPKGPEAGVRRIVRGGSWASYAGYCRIATRVYDVPRMARYFHGFRIALPPPPEP